jgi:short subunit dehydrogenase-like uncharacterized protein
VTRASDRRRPRPRATGRFLLYGATGFSGKLVAERARQQGLAPILAGRDAARVRRLASELDCPPRAFALDAADRIAAAVRDVDVVLNAAGPFAATARPLLDACLRVSVHYLDIAGELPVLEEIAQRSAEAQRRGVMIMPAVGFVVVPSDCLAAHVARRLPTAQFLSIGVSRADALSRGSWRTILDQWSATVAVRRDGVLTAVPIGQRERRFDYGRGPRPSAAVSWGDIATAHRTTGIPNVETYLEVSPSERAMFRFSGRLLGLMESTRLRQWLRAPSALLPEGPTAQQRADGGRAFVAEARDAQGRRVRSRLRTPEAYSFTAATAVAVVERVLHGDLRAGFQTPAGAYGPDFVLTIPAVAREDLPD